MNNPSSRLALSLGSGYLLITYALFFLGPYIWPLPEWWPITLYVPFIFVVLALGHIVGASGQPATASLRNWRKIFIVGGVASVVLLFPSSLIYTGRWPWQILDALADQNAAYQSLRTQLQETQGSRGYFAFIRALFSPLTFAVLPMGILYWKQLNPFYKLLLFSTVISGIVFSILRGTTRELADILVIGGSIFLVKSVRNAKGLEFFKKNIGKIIIASILSFCVIVVLVGRTQARMGSQIESTCVGGGYVCPDFVSPPYGDLPDAVVYGITTLTGYLSQGYYGLGLAMQKPFYFTNGLGHSPALLGLHASITGNDELITASYPYRLRQDGWSEEYQWSTMLPWLANDVSFWGVPILIFVLGLLWGKSWCDATDGKNDRAAIFFCITMMMIFYLPANNQMMQTFDSYSTFIIWLIVWLNSKNRG